MKTISGASRHGATELATSLAMMHATLESTTDAILVTDAANYVTEFNEKCARLWGLRPHVMVSARAEKLWKYISSQLKDPASYLVRVQEIVSSSDAESFDVFQLKDGRFVECNSAIQLVDQQSVGRVWSFRDITRRKRAEDALANEKRVLEKIASGAPLATVLDVLVRGVEAQTCDGMICSVLVFDDDAQCLRAGAAPGLPEEYNRIIDGVRIGPRVGSCGSAAYKREPVFATDIASDPHWADYVELAATFGLGSCCSTPVFSSDGILLGTVAMYYRRPHEPSAHDRELIRMAAHLAGIVIERARAVEQLRVAKVAAEQRAQEIKNAYDILRTTQEALNAELAGAVDYVLSLLPRPITEQHVSADWSMTTSAQLGGDGLGYHWMDSQRFAFYLLDVSGHGVKSALLAVSIIDTLRTCGLANTDWNDPGAVLRALNRVYFSQSHDQLVFHDLVRDRGPGKWNACATPVVAILQRLSVARDAARPGYRRAVRLLVALPTLNTRLWRCLYIFRLNCIFFRMVCLKRVGIRIVNLSIVSWTFLLRHEMARAEASRRFVIARSSTSTAARRQTIVRC